MWASIEGNMAFLTDLRNLAGNRAEEGGGHTHPAADLNGEPGRDLAEAGAHTRGHAGELCESRAPE